MQKLADARKIGRVDEDIGTMIDFLNSKDAFYTTSTCSGRITLITLPESGRKDESLFVHKKHTFVDADAMFETLKELVTRTDEEVWFRMEGLIMHVGCKTLENANALLACARVAGLKKSTIFSAQKQIIVEINTSQKIDTLVAERGTIVVPKAYFTRLVEKANSKLKEVKKKNEQFFSILKQTF